jgi:predicted MFS family arabinose efflux permease
LFSRLSRATEATTRTETLSGLDRSRGVVLKLSALFALDSFGGGFAVQSMLALWLSQRFGLSLAELGSFFFAASTLSAFSQFLSARLAARIGLVETMVFTHLPANALLIASVFMPTAPLALACLLARGALSQMDVPARQSYVMAVVPPEERAAAASVTNVPRSLASAIPPLRPGRLQHSSFGWPLICAGSFKIAYDLLLLWQFRAVPPHSLDAAI